jgi:histone H3/H4
MALAYLQKSKVRRYMKDRGLKTSSIYLEALDREVAVLMEKHQRMAKADRRKTVMAIDIDLDQTIKSLQR